MTTSTGSVGSWGETKESIGEAPRGRSGGASRGRREEIGELVGGIRRIVEESREVS